MKILRLIGFWLFLMAVIFLSVIMWVYLVDALGVASIAVVIMIVFLIDVLFDPFKSEWKE